MTRKELQIAQTGTRAAVFQKALRADTGGGWIWPAGFLLTTPGVDRERLGLGAEMLVLAVSQGGPVRAPSGIEFRAEDDRSASVSVSLCVGVDVSARVSVCVSL